MKDFSVISDTENRITFNGEKEHQSLRNAGLMLFIYILLNYASSLFESRMLSPEFGPGGRPREVSTPILVRKSLSNELGSIS